MARKKPKPPMTQADRPEDILDRVILKNDENAVPDFREMLKKVPAMIEIGGNLAEQAERLLAKRISRGQVWAEESLIAKAASLRAELAGPNSSPLNRLLVERVIACWLQVYYADAIVGATEQCTFAQGDYNQRQQDRAHRRFLSAIKTLATVCRLALPTLVAVNVTGTVETKEADPAPVSRPWRLPVETNN